jgi:hypothetical protein
MNLSLTTAVAILLVLELAALIWCIALVRVSAWSQRTEALELKRWIGSSEQ